MDSKNGESNFRVRVTNVGKEKTEEQYVKSNMLRCKWKFDWRNLFISFRA